MTYQPPASGQGNVAEYMVSGLPWVTQSLATTTPTKIEFPFLTINFTIQNTGADKLFVGWTENGVLGSNKFTVAPSGSVSCNFRLKDLFLVAENSSTTYEVIAGLTTVSNRSFPTLTGSAIYNSSSTDFIYMYGIPGTPGYGSGIG